MPGPYDGIGLARLVRLAHPTIPIALVTGYSDRPTDDLKLPVFLKPVAQSTLAEMLEVVRAARSPEGG